MPFDKESAKQASQKMIENKFAKLQSHRNRAEVCVLSCLYSNFHIM